MSFLLSVALAASLQDNCFKYFERSQVAVDACLAGGKMKALAECGKQYGSLASALSPASQKLIEDGLKDKDAQEKLMKEMQLIADSSNQRAACEGGWHFGKRAKKKG